MDQDTTTTAPAAALQTTAPPRPGPMAATPTRAATVAHAFAGLMPTTIGEAFILAGYLAQSDVIPRSLRKKPESVLAVVMAGMELGLAPVRALNAITIISGNMAMKTDLQLALVRRSGLLTYHDEGFELRGTTDGSLGTRAKDATKILGLVQHVPQGKPYGWCTVQRTGEDQLRTYVFSWVDAERVVASEYEDDADGGGRAKVNKKLSEKHNYVNYPQSMYPRRARGAALQVVFSDALAGIPAVEALEGGQVIAAEFTVADGDGDDIDQLMVKVADVDPELATGITAGFEHLAMGPGRRLQMLTQYRDDPKALYTWLRDEAAKRQGAPAAPPPTPGKKKRAAASHPVEAPVQAGGQPVPPVVEAQVVGPGPSTTAVDDQHRPEPPADPAPTAPPKRDLKSMAAKFTGSF